MSLSGVNLIAVGAGVASVFVLGGLWYSVLFGKAWAAAANLADAKRLPEGVVYGATLLMNIIAAFAFGLLLGEPIRGGWALGAGALVASPPPWGVDGWSLGGAVPWQPDMSGAIASLA